MKRFTRLSNKYPLLSVICGAAFCVALVLALQWDAGESRVVGIHMRNMT